MLVGSCERRRVRPFEEILEVEMLFTDRQRTFHPQSCRVGVGKGVLEPLLIPAVPKERLRKGSSCLLP